VLCCCRRVGCGALFEMLCVITLSRVSSHCVVLHVVVWCCLVLCCVGVVLSCVLVCDYDVK
jgi:hypothetical protein